ncbi:hypothetical protein [Natronoglomus mannanivorans]|uniref:Uncharacterized protein n=1 Tax=Natronoglomus mannanivorans TaxID=2979990 RepID=A0AAP2Z427_9EURY|nr:hypothetical protein [Halobacteria archaeon AArc-xg1-1]
MPDTITVDCDAVITAYQRNSTNTNLQYRVRVYEDGHTDIVNANDYEMNSEIERIPPRRFVTTDHTDPDEIDMSDEDAVDVWADVINLSTKIMLARGYEPERTVEVIPLAD